VIPVTSGKSLQIKSREALSRIQAFMACVLLLIARRSNYPGAIIFSNATDRCSIARRSRLAGSLVMLIGCASRVVHAASAVPFAAPAQVAAPSSTSGLLRVTVALVVVLGAVILAARLARRVRGLSGGGSGAVLEVLGQLSLGARERAVLVRVGQRQLLIGVAPGNVRTLHVFEEPALTGEARVNDTATQAAGGVERPSFKALLLKSLGK
jgi:flagellar protein FliO/FliZ